MIPYRSFPEAPETYPQGADSAPAPISGLSRSFRATFGAVRRSVQLLSPLLPALVLGISAVSVPVMMLSSTGLPRLRALKEEKAKVDLEVSRLADQIRQLRAEVRHVKDDPAKVEQVARDQLGLLRQTEIVFQFSD